MVLATRDRKQRLLATLDRLHGLHQRPRVVVVDNASLDATAAAVRERYPQVAVIVSGRHIGSAARTLGAEAADTPLVAFSDDDSWWAHGALSRAAALFEAYPRLGLIAARILVEPSGHLDPTCEAMRASPLRSETSRPVVGGEAAAASG